MFRACATIGELKEREEGREGGGEAAFFKPKSERLGRRCGRQFLESLSSCVSLHSDSRTSLNAMALSLSYGHLVRRGGCAYVTTVPDQIRDRFSSPPGHRARRCCTLHCDAERQVESVSRREILARSRGLSENRYDSFSSSLGAAGVAIAERGLQWLKRGEAAETEEEEEEEKGMCLFFFPSIKCSVLQKMRFTFR